MTRILLLLVLLYCSVAVNAATMLTVDLKEKVTVKSGVIRLSDVATITGTDKSLTDRLKDLPLQRSPRAGYTTILSQEFIRKVVTRKRIVKHNELTFLGAKQTRVEVDYVLLPVSEYLRRAELSLYQSLASKYTNVELKPVGIYKPLNVPVDKLEIKVIQGVQAVVAKRMQVLIAVYSSEGLYTKIPVWFAVKAKAIAYKTNQPVSAGMNITDNQFERALVDIDDIKEGMILDWPQAQDMLAKRNMVAGEILQKTDLKPGFDVMAGQYVDVYVRFKGIELQTRALAVDDANIGQKVRLKNAGSNEIYQGIVLGINKVKSM